MIQFLYFVGGSTHSKHLPILWSHWTCDLSWSQPNTPAKRAKCLGDCQALFEVTVNHLLGVSASA